MVQISSCICEHAAAREFEQMSENESNTSVVNAKQNIVDIIMKLVWPEGWMNYQLSIIISLINITINADDAAIVARSAK
jgi:hypothetical protein